MQVELDIRYARAPNGGHVAYGTAGSGPGFLFMSGHVCMSDIQHAQWIHRDFSEMASTHTFIAYDHLGGGLSTRECRDYSLEGLVGELKAVLDAAGADSTIIFTCATDTPAAIRFAALYPERVSALCIANGYPRGRGRVQLPRAQAYMRTVYDDWELAPDAIARLLMGWSGEAASRLAGFIRGTTTHEIFIEFASAATEHDASADLERVQAPTLILYTHNDYVPVELSQEMASGIPNAQLAFVALESSFRPLMERARPFLASLAPPAGTAPPILTARERELLCLLARGASNEAIAADLTLSTRTVERHVQNIYTKLGVHNRVEAANWARDHGVL